MIESPTRNSAGWSVAGGWFVESWARAVVIIRRASEAPRSGFLRRMIGVLPSSSRFEVRLEIGNGLRQFIHDHAREERRSLRPEMGVVERGSGFAFAFHHIVPRNGI